MKDIFLKLILNILKNYITFTMIYQGLVLKKVHRMIKFNQKAWLKLYIRMNTDTDTNE